MQHGDARDIRCSTAKGVPRTHNSTRCQLTCQTTNVQQRRQQKTRSIHNVAQDSPTTRGTIERMNESERILSERDISQDLTATA